MTTEDEMRAKLENALSPSLLEIVNESHLHQGHAGSPGTGNSHFRMKIISDAFSDKSRVDRHRLVNEALKDELAGKIHALALALHAPDETGAES